MWLAMSLAKIMRLMSRLFGNMDGYICGNNLPPGNISYSGIELVMSHSLAANESICTNILLI